MKHNLNALLFTAALSMISVGSGRADMLTFDSPEEWQSWQMPYGLVQSDDDGRLQLVKFRKEINAVENAHLFTHTTQTRGVVSGGIWAAGSNPDAAIRIIDGDSTTYWKPAPSALPEDWFVDINLGRAVLAREIRLTFPDQEGARPFRQFTVYATTGARIQAIDDIFKYKPVYRTSQPNQATSIVIPLAYAGTDSTLVVDEGMGVDLAYESYYQVIQYISIVIEEQSEDAALAEVEVMGVGDNVSLGTQQRGSFVNGLVAVQPENLFDGDMNTFGMVTSGHEEEGGEDLGWQGAGTWWGVDLGAVFFIDDLFFYFQNRDEGVSGYIWFYSSSGPGFQILYSDGQGSINSTLPVPQALDYDKLLTHIDPRSDGLFQLRYLFRPRKMRYLFWHGTTPLGWQESRTMELMLFSPGHPAQVTLTSDFIDLGEISGDQRPKVIKNLSWDADLPVATRLQLRSRSGNTMELIYTFYDKKGTPVTENKWNSLPKVIRGLVDTTIVVGDDWGEWSNVYQFSGETFQSESPRRFVQLELLLSTDDPQVAPTVRSLSLEYEDALLQEAKGSILPRQARPNEDTRFIYTLWPGADDQDSGFDLLRFILPASTDAEGVTVYASEREIAPTRVFTVDDSLFVALPEKIAGDSLQIGFTTRVVQNATLFPLDLGDSDRPRLWQSVVPAERRSNIVLLPELAGSDRLIDDLRIVPPIFSPNGDGINDQVEVDFVIYKIVAAEPRVQVFDVSGRLVADLTQTAGDASHRTFTWSGRDFSDRLVQPGIYLCRIDLDAESGEDVAVRTFVVAY